MQIAGGFDHCDFEMLAIVGPQAGVLPSNVRQPLLRIAELLEMHAGLVH